MPKLLPIVIRVANEKGIVLRGFEAPRIAAKLEKRFQFSGEPDPYKYVLDYWDETGEQACGFTKSESINNINAAQRVAKQGVAA